MLRLSNLKLRWLVASGLVVLAAGTAGAQATGGSMPPDATLGASHLAAMSSADMLKQAEINQSRLENQRNVISRLLSTARAQKDVVKTLCLNDKLNQLDVAGRSLKERTSSLRTAAQRGDNDLANHEYTIISVLRGRSEQLSGEANQCVGQEVEVVGASVVTTSIDGFIPDEESSFAQGGPGTIIGSAGDIAEPPHCTSCIK